MLKASSFLWEGMVRHTIGLMLMCACLMSCTYEISQREVLFPHRVPGVPEGISAQPVSILSPDGIVLKGSLIGKQGNKRLIVYFYGNAENALTSSPYLSQMADTFGADVLVVDYRGYGYSEGAASIAQMPGDAELVYSRALDIARQRGQAVFVYGRSLGSALAVHVAVEVNEKPAGVILQSPMPGVAQVLKSWRGQVPWYMRWAVRIVPDAQLKALGERLGAQLKSLTVPLLVLHGTKDATIPVALGREAYGLSGSLDKRWCELEGRGHNDIVVSTEQAARKCVEDFLGAH